MSFQNEGPTDEYAQIHKPPKKQQPKQMVTSYIYSYVHTSVATYIHTYIYSYVLMYIRTCYIIATLRVLILFGEHSDATI